MKNILLKFAGLFVEKIPVDERGNPVRGPIPGPSGTPGAQPGHGGPMQIPATGTMPTGHPAQAQSAGQPPIAGFAPGPQQPAQPGSSMPAVAIALRAWVPQEYAAHLAPFGLHVIAAGGSVTSEQARGWGAQVLVVSAECLGQDVHLLQQPQLPTVFITPQPMMIPEVPGVVQVQEPLRASDVAQAARTAASTFIASQPT